MTVSTTANRISYTGDGSTTAFAVNFPFFLSTDLIVYLIDAFGSVTQQTLTTNYTVSGGSDANGTVTMNVAPPAGYTLLIVRQTPITQSDHFIDNDINDATVQEQALDRLTMLVQETNNLTGRAISQPISDVSSMAALPSAGSRAGKYLAFDSNGNPTATVEVGSWRGSWAVGTVYIIGDVIVDGAAGNNTLDVYTCLKENTASASFATDLAAGDWGKVVDFVALGANAGTAAVNSLSGTSTTSLTVGTGSQTLTTQGSKNFTAGAFVLIVDSAATTNWMAGQVTSYNSTSGALVANVITAAGSGTIATWNVYVSGAVTGGYTVPTGGTTGQSLIKNSGSNGDTKWGQPPLLGLQAVATLTGTAVSFTGIPSTARRITITVANLQTNGTSLPLLRVGNGSVVTSGYKSSVTQLASGATSVNETAGFALAEGNASTCVYHGNITLTLLDPTNNVWGCAISLGRSDAAANEVSAGSITLSSALDRVQFTMVNGTDAFSGGTANALLE